jgi:gliding motility-associated-like protein
MYKLIFKFGISILILFFSTSVNSQMVINPNGPITPQQAVQDILIGAGIQAFNVTYNGSAVNAQATSNSVLQFGAGATAFPINSGVLMQTQGAPSVNNDPDLMSLAGQNVTNGVVLEFDFIPSGDTLSFKYLFASAEYTSYTCSNFNDVFGFLISGPGIAGGQGFLNDAMNLAVVPGSANIPVAINTVNSGSAGFNSPANCAAADPNWQSNSVYFTLSYNPIFTGTPAVANFNGATIVLTANSDLVCGQVYHIKLAIANAVDTALDSGVFLEASSFSSEAVEVSVATVSGDTTVYEGCTEANLMFIRPQTQLGDTLIINYTVTGTATEGTDFNDLINPITFLPGEDTIVLTINPTFDGISDNGEFVTITAITISQCGDTVISSGTLYIFDSIPININESNPTVQCYNDSVLVTATATGLFPPYTIAWEGGQTGGTAYFPTISGTMQGTVDYLVTATNSCGYSATDTVTITLNQTLAVDTLLSWPADCNPIGAVSASISGQTGVPLYNWTGPGPNNPNFINASVWEDLSSGWYYFTVTDDVCEANDSVFVDIIDPPLAQFQVNPNDGCTPLTVLITNNSQNASQFSWDFGNGNTANVGNMDAQTQVYTTAGTIRLIASEGNCRDTAYASITISVCGCMDPLAVNYNPLANYDDGSCLYPAPTVYVPNVFTPNGDNSNDLFFLTTTNSTRIEITILNRWGNVVYEGSGVNPAWDGESENGVEVGDGVYFVKYRVEGLMGTDGEVQFLEGHGFVHLIR